MKFKYFDVELKEDVLLHQNKATIKRNNLKFQLKDPFLIMSTDKFEVSTLPYSLIKRLYKNREDYQFRNKEKRCLDL